MRILNKFKKMKMHKKLMLSYTAPLLLVVSVCYFAVYPSINEGYQRKIMDRVYQNVDQAASFLVSQMQNMQQMVEILLTDNQIVNLLYNHEFYIENKLNEVNYSEYITLIGRLMEINDEKSSLWVQLYLPDYFTYTVNRKYIRPMKELKEDLLVQSLEFDDIFHSTQFTIGKEDTGIAEYDALMMYKGISYIEENEKSVVKISLHVKEILQILENISISEHDMIFLLDEKQNILLSTAESEYPEKIDFSMAASSFQEGMGTIQIGGNDYYIFESSVITSICDWKIVISVPHSEINGEIRLITYYSWFLLFITIATILLFSGLISRYYGRKLHELKKQIKAIKEGKHSNALLYIDVENGDEIDEIYQEFQILEKRLSNLMIDQYNLGKEVKSYEMKALQAQINPHFLYNSLDLINWMALDFGVTEISDLSRSLAKFYRLSLNKGKSVLLIKEELAHVRYFVEIENFHYENAIHLHEDIDPRLEEYACLNIVLQPFVENAIVHSIAKKPEIKTCHIWISAIKEGSDIVFCVKDNGPGMDEEQLHHMLPDGKKDGNYRGYGVKNVHFRLQLCFGEKYGLRYTSIQGTGTSVFIRIPAMTIKEMEKMVG